MSLRTEISPRFLVRMGIVGVMCTGMCLYCIYDGKVTYPNQRARALEYQEFSAEHADLDEKDRVDKWDETALSSHGWTADLLKEPKTQYQIYQQFYMAGATGLIGFFFLYKLISNLGRWIEADDKRLWTSEKREVTYDAIASLDKKKWDNKGIAKVLYENNGKQQKIVLDDFNYDRPTTDAILVHVENNIDHAKIINGKPEPPPKQQEESVEEPEESVS